MVKIALTNYLLKVNIYKRKELDFFTFLLLQISSKNDISEPLKNVLSECEITPSLMYLFEMAFYNCLDNELIYSSNEDFNSVNTSEIKITESGKKALENSYSLDKTDTREINISINPIKNDLIAYKDPGKAKEYELIEKTLNEDDINNFINNKKMEIFNDKTNDYFYSCRILQVLPTII